MLARLPRHGGAELLVDEHAGDRRVGAVAHRLEHALIDQVLGIGDDRRLLGVGLALDSEELLLERAAVVECEDVELLVIAKCHCLSISEAPWPWSTAPQALSQPAFRWALLEWVDDVLGCRSV